MANNKTVELKILKTILWIYIILCIIIAGLNYGYASKATPEAAAFINWFWHFYENWIKTIFIIICSFLTLRIVSTSKKNTMRKRNLIGIIMVALVVHIVTPLLLNNSELYFFTMPLPWTTTPLQLLSSDSSFYISRFPVWGAAGISAALIFYICISVIVLIGTVLGLVSKISGQRIITNRTKCVQCGKCNDACPMSINIKDNAKEGKAAAELRCVGCGHCVDVCPTRNLGYSTSFLEWVSRKNKVTIEREIDRTVE